MVIWLAMAGLTAAVVAALIWPLTRRTPVVAPRAQFDAAVYRAVRDLGWGDRATYGDVAVAAGRPGAARAVGGAMARCPIFPAVPCHRVVRAADGWSGWGPSGDARKRALLDREED